MIELLPVKVHYAGIAAFVVGVAGATGQRLFPTVVAGLAADIGTDVLVALRAQPILRFAVESGVAGLAIVFGFLMPEDQFTGGDDGFDALRSGVCNRYGKYCHQGDGKQTLPVDAGQRVTTFSMHARQIHG